MPANEVVSLIGPEQGGPSGTVNPAKEETAQQRGNAFATLLNSLPTSTSQEVRVDDSAAGDLYIGRAADGTATSSAVWEVVRFYRTAGAITRIRYRTGVAWDSRTSGWT